MCRLTSMTSRLSSIRVGLDVGGLEDLRAERASRDSRALRSRNARAAAGGEPAVVGPGGLADQRVADRGHPLPDHPAPVAERDAGPARRVEGLVEACSAAGRPGGTVGIGGLLEAGDSECDPGHRPPQPRVGALRPSSCSITCVHRARARRLSARAGLRRPAAWAWPWSGSPCWSSPVRRWSRSPGCRRTSWSRWCSSAWWPAASALAWWLRTRAWVCAAPPTATGSGWCAAPASRRRAGAEVEDAVTAYRRGVACVVLRLRDGRTTTIPVGVLAVDKDEFVRELRAGCSAAAGSGRLTGRGPVDSSPTGRLVACCAVRRRRLVRSMAPAC